MRACPCCKPLGGIFSSFRERSFIWPYPKVVCVTLRTAGRVWGAPCGRRNLRHIWGQPASLGKRLWRMTVRRWANVLTGCTARCFWTCQWLSVSVGPWCRRSSLSVLAKLAASGDIRDCGRGGLFLGRQ